MPSMANITVKKNDGTTDIIYNALIPSGGDKLPARWEVTAMAGVRNRRALLECSTQPNNPNTGRRVHITHRYPSIIEVNGVEKVVWRVIKLETFNDEGVPDADINESSAQFGNLVDSALVQEILKSGFAPT